MLKISAQYLKVVFEIQRLRLGYYVSFDPLKILKLNKFISKKSNRSNGNLILDDFEELMNQQKSNLAFP